MPKKVILDPTLLHGCPRAIVAAAGMDALTQAYESYVSRAATEFTRVISETALLALVRSLPLLYHGYGAAAGGMLEGSYLAGLALAHARLGLVHGLAHPLGARWHVPHGLVCACCLPHVLRFNEQAAASAHERLRVLLGRDFAGVVREFLKEFGLHSPFVAAKPRETEAMVRETMQSGSTAANPRVVTPPDVEAILDELFRA